MVLAGFEPAAGRAPPGARAIMESHEEHAVGFVEEDDFDGDANHEAGVP